MNFQVTVLKILVSYPGGFAGMADLKRDMAILATSGPYWADRTTRLAARVPDLDIFSQGLIERMNGGWRITDKGRAVLDVMEARHPAPQTAHVDASHPATSPPPFPIMARPGKRTRRQRRQAARERARAKAS